MLTKVCIVMAFLVVIYRCESWAIKKDECWRFDAFELCCWRRFLRVPWTARSKSINPKVNKTWIFTGRTDAEAPIVWPTDAKNWLIWKDPDDGKDWGHEEKVVTEDEMVGWHHWLDGHEFEQTQGDSERQGSLACCSSWGHKESEVAQWQRICLNMQESQEMWVWFLGWEALLEEKMATHSSTLAWKIPWTEKPGRL